MGSGSSRERKRIRECERLEKERENLHRAREEQLKKKLRLEKQKNLYHRAREDLAVKAFEIQQRQNALRRSNAETQRQLYLSLNIVGSPRNESCQTAATAVPNLAVNHDHFRQNTAIIINSF